MTTPILVARNTKSVGIAILLTLLFGPIGLFYASVLGGVVMTVLPVILILLVIYGYASDFMPLLGLSVGLLIILYVSYWLIIIAWAILSVNNHNREIEEETRYQLQLMSMESRSAAHQIVVNVNQRATDLPVISNEQHDKSTRPNIQEWLKNNPNKSVNDYFIKFGR